MSASNRAKLIGKLHTALKKHYSPISAGNRSLLEHVLYASLLQDATYEAADDGLAKCENDFFDWNEVRVTTVTELAQVLSGLPDPTKAAQRLKGNLQSLFEEFYTFELDHLRKENLGKAVAKFEKMPQMTPFVLSYTVQHGLGGHAIPVDYSSLVIMLNTGIISQSEAASGRVPGLERAVPKSKGVEFGSLLHQAGVALANDPNDSTARSVMDETAKGSAKAYDEWSASKTAAKKRVRKRKLAEREAAKVAAAEEAVAEPATKKKSASKLAAAKASKSKAAAGPAENKGEKPTKPVKPTKPKAAAKPAEEPAGDAKSTKAAATKKASKAAAKPKAAATEADVKKTAKSKTAKASKPSAAKTSSAAAKKAPKKKAPAAKATAKKSTAKKPTTKKAAAKKTTGRKLTKKKPR